MESKQFAKELAGQISKLCDGDNADRNSRPSVEEVKQAYEIFVLPYEE